MAEYSTVSGKRHEQIVLEHENDSRDISVRSSPFRFGFTPRTTSSSGDLRRRRVGVWMQALKTSLVLPIIFSTCKKLYPTFLSTRDACHVRRCGKETSVSANIFVEMASGGNEAIAALHEKDFDGRNLTVNLAKPREQHRPTGGKT